MLTVSDLQDWVLEVEVREEQAALESPANGKNIIRGLIARGCSDEDVRKIAGGNGLGLFRRVMGSGEGASRITEREYSLTKLERLGGCYARSFAARQRRRRWQRKGPGSGFRSGVRIRRMLQIPATDHNRVANQVV